MRRKRNIHISNQFLAHNAFHVVVFLLTLVLLFSLMSPILSVRALSGITVTPITTVAVLDSNDSCQVHKPVPSAMYIEVQITNTSGAAINNLTANIGSFTTTPSPLPAIYKENWGLAGGETAQRSIGTLAAGAATSLFWFVDFPCYNGTLNSTGATLNYTVTISNGTLPNVTQNGSIVMRGEQSAAAGGVLFSEQIGAGAVVGQILKVTDVYSFGNTGSNQTINIQPVGNYNRPTASNNFNAGCFRLIGVDIIALTGSWSGINTTDFDNRLMFANVTASSTNNEMTVDYYFYALCTTSSGTIALPYSDLGSGTQFKYLSNFGSCSSTPCQYTLPVVSNAFTISKTANPTWLISGGTVTYTVTISNTSAYPASIDSIQDVLPPSSSYIGLTAGSQVTAANSSSVPTAGAAGTIQWIGKPATSCSGGCNNTYQIGANSSLTLQYTVSIPSAEGTYTNSATASAGSTTIGPKTSTVTVGKLTPLVTTTIHEASHAAVTSVPAGAIVHDSATVIGSGPIPTGTVDFTWLTTIDCTGTPVSAGTIDLTDGIAHPSSSEGPLAAGVYSFRARYNGDSNYKTADSDCESLTVLSAPSIVKSFGAATIPLNGTTTLTFTITNPNAGTVLNGVAFIDTLPAGFTVASSTSNQCGGTLITVAPETIALSGGSIAAAGTCTLNVTVTGTTVGAKTNTTGNVTSANGGTGNTASAPLTVVAPPQMIKSFSAASIPLNGTSTLTFIVINPNIGTDLTGVTFTDNLPSGLVVATPNGLSGSCGGGTITATQATGIVNLSNASLPADSSCTFSINVTGTAAGVKNNNATVSSTNGGTGNIAIASISVAKLSPGISTILSAFSITEGESAYDTAALSGASTNAGGTVTYTVYTDATCTSGARSAGTKTVTNGVVPNSDPLSFDTAGTYYWQAVYSGDANNNGATSECTSESLTVASAPVIPITGAKVFNPEIIKAGENTDLGIWLYAPADTDLTSVSLTDHLPDGFVITNSSPAYVVCSGGGITGNLTATTGSNVITWTNGMIIAGEFCRIDVFVTGTTMGTFYNTIDRLLDVSNDQGRPLESDLTYPIRVNKATPTLSTILSFDSVLVGDSVYDTAVLSNASPTAGGTETYTVYTDDACALGARSAGTKTVTNGSVPNSDSLAFSSPGTYYWQAEYSGDENNEPAVSECTSEILVVEKLTPTVATTIHDSNENVVTSVVSGSTVHDSASVTGTPGFAVPSGSMTFAWYPNGTCTGTSSDAGTVSLDSGTAHPSTSQGPLAAGSYSFKAFYNGDSIYETTESNCEPLNVSEFQATVSKALTASNWSFSMPMDHVAIGEIVTYETTFSVPPGSIDNLNLIDTLDAGLAYMSCESITGPTSYTCASIPTVLTALPDASNEINKGRQIEFSFGTVNNSDSVAQDLTMRYRAIVLDSAENLRGKTLNNSAVWSWNSSDPDTPSTQAALPVSIVILEPSLAISKSISPTLIDRGGTVDVTIVISHTAESNQSAFDVDWIDPLPAGLTYVPGSLAFSGQLPSSSNDASLPNLTATWDALTLSGGPATITFKVTVNMAPGTSATNSTAVAWTSLPGDFTGPQTLNNLLSHERFYDPASPVDIYTVSASGSVTVRSAALPGTGFAPGRITLLEKQPDGLAYTDSNNLYLEIPTLHKLLKIVGVPQSASGWDVTWLGNQAGYLQGTAFPSWKGNSVITAHVYDANGKPGPFIDLPSLRWGDRIIIHAYGTQYIYQVREVIRTIASDPALLRHEDYPWVTLVTCQGYDARSNSYAYRIGVRAVLIDSRTE